MRDSISALLVSGGVEIHFASAEHGVIRAVCREPGVTHQVSYSGDGTGWNCDCGAHRGCRHVNAVKKVLPTVKIPDARAASVEEMSERRRLGIALRDLADRLDQRAAQATPSLLRQAASALDEADRVIDAQSDWK